MPKVVAVCHGIAVPMSPYLTDTRTERINAERYEAEEIAGALALVRPGDTVLELGAGLGIVGAVIAKKCEAAQVLSYEANPHLIPHIRTLYALNGLESTNAVHNQVVVAGSDIPETLPFHIHSSYLGSSLAGRGGPPKELVDVQTRSFETLRNEVAPDILVMDIEGAELDFLRNADLTGLRGIVLEFHPKTYGRAGMRECKTILRGAGFEPVPEASTRFVWAAARPD